MITTSVETPTRTTLAPLTTVFVPPTGCARALQLGEREADIWAATCKSIGSDFVVVSHASSCYPSGLVSFWYDHDVLTTVPFYSPGVSCPQGFTTACSLTRSDDPQATKRLSGADSRIWNQLWVGETAIGCCPSGYGCDTQDPVRCTSTATPGQVLTGLGFDSRCSMTPGTTTFSGSKATPVGSAFRVEMILPGPTRTGGPPQPTPSPPSTSSSEDIGTIVGVNVGGGVVVFLFLLLLWYVGWVYSTEEERKQGVVQVFVRGVRISWAFKKAGITSPLKARRAAAYLQVNNQ